MFFYVDETGHTGSNLFDKTQPTLSYGVISSESDLDLVAEPTLERLRKRFNVERLHANELGIHKVTEIIDDLLILDERFGVNFDIWMVEKKDHAIISFFDQVFDQGMNPVVPWTAYWTPLRYPLLLNLSNLFDIELEKKSWKARLEANDRKSLKIFEEICNVLRDRVYILDARSAEIITDALDWACVNFSELGYNCKSNKDRIHAMPNMVGFQSVMHGICHRLGAPNKEARIVVDQQSQFNTTQRELGEFYYNIRNDPFQLGPGLPVMDMSNMPKGPINFLSSHSSSGLEIVDVYLWVFKRFIEGKSLTKKLEDFVKINAQKTFYDAISLESIAKRFKEDFEKLPEPTPKMLEENARYKEFDEERRLKHRIKK